MLIKELWETIISYPWMAITLAVWLTIWKFAATALSKDETLRTRIGVVLVGSSFRSRYRAMLTRCLDWLDYKLSPDELAENTTLRPRAWGFGLLNLSIIVAFVYPIFCLLITWALTNDGAIAGIYLLEPNENKTLRYAIAVGIPIFILIFVLIRVYLRDPLRKWFVFALMSIAVGLVVLSATAVGKTVLGTGMMITTILIMGTYLSGFILAFAIGNVIASTSTNIVTISFLLASAVAATASSVMTWIGQKTHHQTTALATWVVIALCVVVGTVFVANDLTDAGNDVPPTGVILFVGILPMLNALFDFLSIGLTRFCLRRGLEGNRLLWATIDLVGALLCFAILGISLVLLIQFVTPRNGLPLLDLTLLFQTLNDPANWSQYTWLGFMMFSTLLPTIAHAILALAAFFLRLLKPLQPHLGEWIVGGPVAVHVAWFAISLIGVFAISAALTIPFVVADHYIHIIAQTISFFEGFARWSGAI